jgi:hypothetical protein
VAERRIKIRNDDQLQAWAKILGKGPGRKDAESGGGGMAVGLRVAARIAALATATDLGRTVPPGNS